MITSLFLALLACEDLVQEQGILSMDQAAYCMNIYETLKDEVANGDYLQWREWRQENEPAVRELYDASRL